MITYTYKVNRLICSQTDPLRPNFVSSAEFLITGVDDIDNISSSIVSVLGFHIGETFIPFNELREIDVISWIELHPAINLIRTKVDELIRDTRLPLILEKPLPWVTPT